MYLSVTQMEMLLGCPLKWLYDYKLKKLPRQNPYHFPLGTAVHAAIEHNLLQKITSRTDLPVEDLLAAFDRSWEAETHSKPVQWYDNLMGRDIEPDEAAVSGRRMVAAYHEQLSPMLQPTGAEVDFKLNLGFLGYPGDFFVDKIDGTGTSNHPKYRGRTVVVDHKTSAARWKQESTTKLLQPRAYAAALEKLRGELTDLFLYLVVTKPLFGREPACQIVPVEITRAGVDLFWDQVVACLKIAKGTEFRKDPSYKYHAYCPYRAECTPEELEPKPPKEPEDRGGAVVL